MAMRFAILLSLLLVALGAAHDVEARPRHLRKRRHSRGQHPAHHGRPHRAALLADEAATLTHKRFKYAESAEQVKTEKLMKSAKPVKTPAKVAAKPTKIVKPAERAKPVEAAAKVDESAKPMKAAPQLAAETKETTASMKKVEVAEATAESTAISTAEDQAANAQLQALAFDRDAEDHALEGIEAEIKAGWQNDAKIRQVKKTIDAEETLLHEEDLTAKTLSLPQAETAKKELVQMQGMEEETKTLMEASKRAAIDAGNQAASEAKDEGEKAQATIKASEAALSMAESARGVAQRARAKAANLVKKAQQALAFFSDWDKDSQGAVALVATPAVPAAPAAIQAPAAAEIAKAPVALMAKSTGKVAIKAPEGHEKTTHRKPAAAAAPVEDKEEEGSDLN